MHPSSGSPLSRLLTTLSQRLRVDLSYLVHGTAWGLLGQAVSALSAFVLSVLFAHYASKETVGTYRYLLSVANLLTAFSLSGLNTSIIQSVARGYEGAFTGSFRKSLVWSLPAIVLSFGVGTYYFVKGNTTFGYGIPLVTILVNLWNALLLFRSFLTGKRALQTLFLANTGIAIFPLLSLFFGLQFTQQPVSLLAIFLSSTCLVTAIAHRLATRQYLQNHTEDPEHDRYSAHLSALYVLDTIASQLDKVFVFQAIGSVPLATYTYATALPEQMRALLKNVQTAILPKFSVRPLPAILKELNHKILLSTLALIGIAGGYILIAPLFFRIFFPTYLEAVWLSQLFALIIVFENGLIGVVFKAKRAIKEQYVTNIAGNLLKILLMALFLRWYGLVGLVLARVLARAGSFAASLLLVRRLRRQAEIALDGPSTTE